MNKKMVRLVELFTEFEYVIDRQPLVDLVRKVLEMVLNNDPDFDPQKQVIWKRGEKIAELLKLPVIRFYCRLHEVGVICQDNERDKILSAFKAALNDNIDLRGKYDYIGDASGFIHHVTGKIKGLPKETLLKALLEHLEELPDKNDHEWYYLAKCYLFAGIDMLAQKRFREAERYLLKANKLRGYLKASQLEQLDVGLIIAVKSRNRSHF